LRFSGSVYHISFWLPRSDRFHLFYCSTRFCLRFSHAVTFVLPLDLPHTLVTILRAFHTTGRIFFTFPGYHVLYIAFTHSFMTRLLRLYAHHFTTATRFTQFVFADIRYGCHFFCRSPHLNYCSFTTHTLLVHTVTIHTTGSVPAHAFPLWLRFTTVAPFTLRTPRTFVYRLRTFPFLDPHTPAFRSFTRTLYCLRTTHHVPFAALPRTFYTCLPRCSLRCRTFAPLLAGWLLHCVAHATRLVYSFILVLAVGSFLFAFVSLHIFLIYLR